MVKLHVRLLVQWSIFWFLLTYCKAVHTRTQSRGRIRRHATLSGGTSAHNDKHDKVAYGIELPAFSFDFSEYFSSAIIERSFDSSDLHLVMFLVGHRSIRTDYPFEAISTDDVTLFSWGQAVKHWAPERTLSASSGMFCVMQNNDGNEESSPYLVPAFWVHVDDSSNRNATNFKGNFAILRCKIKMSLAILTNITSLSKSDARLFVDITRRKTSSSSQGQSNYSTKINGSEDNNALNPVAISFNVPWKTRQTGYGFAWHSARAVDPASNNSTEKPEQHSTSSAIDAWQFLSLTETSKRAVFMQSVSTGFKTVMCVPGLRPAHPIRPDVGIPMLLEFVEHHLLLGIDHLYLGLMVDSHSIYMHRYINVLQDYIQEGRVTLISTAMEGYDDVAGFSGMQLNDAYADLFFVNQCLYFNKAMSQYVIALRSASVFLAGLRTNNEKLQARHQKMMEENNRTIVDDILQYFDDQNKLLNSMVGSADNKQFTAPSVTGRVPASEVSDAPVNRNYSIDNLFSRHKAKKLSAEKQAMVAQQRQQQQPFMSSDSRQYGQCSYCSFKLSAVGIQDPPTTFGPWGPKDSKWTREYFKGLKVEEFRDPSFTFTAGNAHTHSLVTHSRDALAIDFAPKPLSQFSERRSKENDGNVAALPIVSDSGPVAYCGFTTVHHQAHLHHCPALFANVGAKLNPYGRSSILHGRKLQNSGNLTLRVFDQHQKYIQSPRFLTAEPQMLENNGLIEPEMLQETTKYLNKQKAYKKSVNSFEQRIAAGGLTFEHTVDPKVLIAIVFLQQFDPKQFSTSERVVFCNNISASISISLHEAANRLKARGISSISSMEKKINSAEGDFSSNGSAIKDRTSVKPPFWQLCNTENLHHVLQRVFL